MLNAAEEAADAYNASEYVPMNPKFGRLQTDQIPASAQKRKQQRRTDQIGQHRRCCDTVRSHADDTDKKQVQEYIEHTGDYKADKRSLRVSLTPKNR